VQNQKVLAIPGGSSLTDCTVSHSYYEQQRYYEITAGVPKDCFFTSNIAAVNMGAEYSTEGASQHAVSRGARKVVVDCAKGPEGQCEISFALDYPKSKGIATASHLTNVPITDANAIALRDVQEAGSDGTIVLNFTAPEGTKIMQAAEQQGPDQQGRGVGWSTPGNDLSVAEAAGPTWNGKMGVNAEMNLLDSNGPDNNLYKQITKQYAPNTSLQTFGQMGFVQAGDHTKTLLQLRPTS
jgi:branched-chain amino acid transport system substrate-binding protein